jgi:PAS domain S-box-containing protein
VRRQVELALRESEARFRRLADNAPDIIYRYEFEPTPRFVYISASFETITGYTLDECYADPLIAIHLIHPDDSQLLNDTLIDPEALPGPFEMRWLHRDGSVLWIEQRNVLLRNEAGAIVAIEGIARDITGRKEAEEVVRQSRDALRAANLELGQSARLKDEFLASMSHELRTPLNTVLGRAELLAEEIHGPLNERQRRSVASIEESGRHLLALINDILDLSKIEANKLDLQSEPVSVSDLCESSIRLVTEAAHKKTITISTDLDARVVLVMGDPRRLKQILVNLLANAVKFTPTGGCVGLELSGDPEGGTVTFTIWDTGIGIAEADLGRLFRPFEQLDSRLSRQYEGTGLGLSLVSRLVHLHGGGVAVSSVLGQGSRFIVTLPWQPRVG